MLSVALCTYNGKKFLKEQLTSILTQSHTIDELVVCDDHSSDETVEIVSDFLTKFPDTIKIHINEVSLGPIKNFEKAIGLCKGEIIFLSDQDDIWQPNKVEKILQKFNSIPTLEAIFSDGELIDEYGKYLKNSLWQKVNFDLQVQNKWTTNEALIDNIYSRNKITGATLAIKKELFLRALPFPLYRTVWHDAWLGIHAAANGTLGWIDEPLIKYRIHSEQQVGVGNGVTLKTKKKATDIGKYLTDSKDFFLNCLIMADQISKKYPHIDKKLLTKEALDWIKFIDIRLNLPKEFIKRIFSVLSNTKAYINHCENFFKPMIKDIIQPAKKNVF